jgi:orotate phosphoribosyltransferase
MVRRSIASTTRKRARSDSHRPLLGLSMSGVSEELRQRIAVALYERGLFRTWYRDRPEGWTLVSGLWSPMYLQLRELASHPALLRDIGEALGQVIREEIGDASSIVGIAYGGIPIAVAASLASGVPAAMTRKLEAKSEGEIDEALRAYGQHASVEGVLEGNSRLVLVDDLVTGFDSKLVAARQVEHEAQRRGLEGVTCRDVAVVVDREQGGAEAARSHGFSLHSVLRMRADYLPLLKERLAPVEHEVVTAYLEDPEPFQDPGEQRRLAAIALEAEGG